MNLIYKDEFLELFIVSDKVDDHYLIYIHGFFKIHFDFTVGFDQDSVIDFLPFVMKDFIDYCDNDHDFFSTSDIVEFNYEEYYSASLWTIMWNCLLSDSLPDGSIGASMHPAVQENQIYSV